METAELRHGLQRNINDYYSIQQATTLYACFFLYTSFFSRTYGALDEKFVEEM